MTIICYRDGVMASDSMVSDGDRLVGWTQKVSRSPTGTIAAASGRDGACAMFHRWVQGGMDGEFKPDCEPGYFGAMYVGPDGVLTRVDAKGNLSVIRAPFHADGSGDKIAIGAMAQGATAEQAVAIAIEWDVCCSGAIQVERLADAPTPRWDPVAVENARRASKRRQRHAGLIGMMQFNCLCAKMDFEREHGREPTEAEHGELLAKQMSETFDRWVKTETDRDMASLPWRASQNRATPEPMSTGWLVSAVLLLCAAGLLVCAAAAGWWGHG